MKKVYLITGAAGHLGSALCMQLKERGEAMRALCMRGEDTTLVRQLGAEVFFGDVTQPETMRPFFTLPEGTQAVLLHCAGVVEIADKHSPLAEKVNVGGTRNVMALAGEYGVSRIVYVCSVHAMPDLAKGMACTEIEDYNPARVEGAYAKSKAQAAREVLALAKEGLPAVVVLPSGIIGPYSGKGNHLVQFVKNYANGKLPACVKGGYDFVDVRDVAQGVIDAVENGEKGQCYLLTGHYMAVRDMLNIVSDISGKKKIKVMLPMWLAKLTAPLAELWYKMRRQPPLFTRYSLYTLGVNSNFDNSKARLRLGFNPRPLKDTLKDTVAWLKDHNRLKTFGKKKLRKKVSDKT